MWEKAENPPDGQVNKWTRDVIAVTNYGKAYSLAYMHGENGGVWQRPTEFDIGEEVLWWAEHPADKQDKKGLLK